MADTHITAQRIDFLRLLTRMGFASTRHLAESGLMPNAMESSQSAFYKPMLDSRLIGRMTVVPPGGIGKRVMYYLTKAGAEFIAEADGLDFESIRYAEFKGGIVKAADTGPRGALVRSNFPHKEGYVSTLIALERYLEGTEYEVTESRHYYDRRIGGTSTAVGGKRFRPDGLAILKPLVPAQPQFSYVIELHRHSDRKHIIAQLKRHVEAYKVGGFARFFGAGNPHFVLSVYTSENVGVMHQVIETLRQDAETWPFMEKFFLFAELAALRLDFYSACAYFGGPKKPLPPTTVGRVQYNPPKLSHFSNFSDSWPCVVSGLASSVSRYFHDADRSVQRSS